MTKAIAASAAIVAVFLSGCATRASSVAPVAITANDYSGLSCADARSQLALARSRENALVQRQNNAALADAASVFLVLVPLGSVLGADVSGELAQAKGETLALERHILAHCSGAATQTVSAAAPPVPAAAPTPALPAQPVAIAQPSKAQCGIVAQTNGGNKLVPC
jgi:hypothetical protein